MLTRIVDGLETVFGKLGGYNYGKNYISRTSKIGKWFSRSWNRKNSIAAGATYLELSLMPDLTGRMLYHNVAGAATLTLPAINSQFQLLHRSQLLNIQTQHNNLGACSF